MLVPIPGFTHLLYLVPDPLTQAIAAQPEVPREVSALVRVALDSAFGLRPVAHLTPKLFDAAVRAHISSRLKRGVEAAELLTFHIQLRDGYAEVCGSLAVGSKRTAYAARLAISGGVWRMLNFRVLT
ncbi:hypothetical protein CDES_03840 [Corynebacterium deserti GIMN1.010]|uniref:Uncharacterized protein n=1 Tax=Corynebacterium deserti GIMN1.010 TaxID=931089 RepID=A0A0M4CWM8_9CORY|nr:Rv3235 family protein [Corynebacterium deserti]ALC05220.1 hypothetical protein CDES_03840 [Corynebacterium deserti GIMN1.010]